MAGYKPCFPWEVIAKLLCDDNSNAKPLQYVQNKTSQKLKLSVTVYIEMFFMKCFFFQRFHKSLSENP